jgi:hypothetical protein
MRRLRPDRIKLFCGLIGSAVRGGMDGGEACGDSGSGGEPIGRALDLLSVEFGPVDHTSPVVPFDFTDYYGKEMGTGLKRQWVSFEILRERSYLQRAKHVAVRIEEALSRDGKRTVNIDPGYVDSAQVVLATSKNFAHRIYIGMGYYAEVTLIHVHGAYRSLDWTYPDYKEKTGMAFFGRARELYRNQVRTS